MLNSLRCQALWDQNDEGDPDGECRESSMLHFIIINIRVHERFGELFEKYMRWPAAGGLVIGWILGVTIDLPDAVIVTVFSLIGGMITYIALKSELPQTGHKAPFHFLAGALIYALVVLAIPYFGLSHLASH